MQIVIDRLFCAILYRSIIKRTIDNFFDKTLRIIIFKTFSLTLFQHRSLNTFETRLVVYEVECRVFLKTHTHVYILR
jgi:hypothetical protein